MRSTRPAILSALSRTPRLLGPLLAAVTLVACASTAPSGQVRIAVAERTDEQRLAFVCAENCESSHLSGSGALFECVRQCPGLEVSEEQACANDVAAYAICYGNAKGSGPIGPGDRDNAAKLAIGVLRGLSDAGRSMAAIDVMGSR